MAEEGLRLVSPPVASHGGRLPRHYTGDGQGAKKDISPPLEWYGVPEGARSLALVAQDIDAPDPDGPIVPWTHWVVVDIPAAAKGLPEGFSHKEEALGGVYKKVKEGNNDWKTRGWRGPVPTSRGHRIQFKLYALDVDELPLGNKVTKERLMEAIEGHVLDEAELVATF